ASACHTRAGAGARARAGTCSRVARAAAGVDGGVEVRDVLAVAAGIRGVGVCGGNTRGATAFALAQIVRRLLAGRVLNLRAFFLLGDALLDLRTLVGLERLGRVLLFERQISLVEERRLAALLALAIRLRDVVQIRGLLALLGFDGEALLERVGSLIEVA